jgi:serine/threonine-protein kinase
MIESDRLLVSKVGEGTTIGARSGRATTGLPPDLLRHASKRLQAVCWLLIGVLSFSWLGGNFVEGELLHEFRTPADWIPPTIMLLASIAVLFLARRSHLSASAIISVGLVYEVVVSWCAAMSQYWGAFVGIAGGRLTSDLVGLSGVAIWMLSFAVLVPAKPRRVLVALVLSGLSVTVTMWMLVRIGDAPPIPLLNFVLVFVIPYAIVVAVAYLAARIIFGLGRDVRLAREMGSYHLLDLIGRGGMGEVWRARHNMLARPAAIKLVRRDALDSAPEVLKTTLTRFEREAQTTAGLRSPHTVELYDFGMSDDGTLYYVMELLDGIDLESLVERYGPLPSDRVVYILRQVCLSLSEAHRQDLVHRDIKPANIYLCEQAFEQDFVKVLDFGLVKNVAAIEAGDDAAMTRAQAVAGTPAYIAPETALGKGTLDGRTDIYSLGCVAFWLLTGRRVFEEETPMAMVVAHTTAIPPRPSESTELPVSTELENLVLTCLAKAPADRPATATEVIHRLDAITLPMKWTPDRAAEWWSLHRP